MGRPYMTVPEVAGLLGLTTVRVYELVRAGQVPHIRRGRRVLIPTEAWSRWMAEQTERALAATIETADR